MPSPAIAVNVNHLPRISSRVKRPNQRFAHNFLAPTQLDAHTSLLFVDNAAEHRVRITYGKTTPRESSYTGDLAVYTASTTTVKLLLNATVSESANLLATDINDFYLGTPIDHPEYI